MRLSISTTSSRRYGGPLSARDGGPRHANDHISVGAEYERTSQQLRTAPPPYPLLHPHRRRLPVLPTAGHASKDTIHLRTQAPSPLLTSLSITRCGANARCNAQKTPTNILRAMSDTKNTLFSRWAAMLDMYVVYTPVKCASLVESALISHWFHDSQRCSMDELEHSLTTSLLS